MKILWISNRRLDVSKKGSFGGGWLISLMNILRLKPDVELSVCYTECSLKSIRKELIDGVWHYGLPRKKNVMQYDMSLEKKFADIIDEIDPEIIHIHGTENANGVAAMRVRPERIYVVSIQGLIGRYAEHYVAGVPIPYCFDLTLRDLLHQDGPISKGKRFKKSSWYEEEMIKNADYIMARTSWDVACVKHLNRKAIIYSDLRVLRPSFYQNRWSLSTCKKYSIFIGSGHNQIKGLHYVLQAMPLILKVYPETHLNIASPDFTRIRTFRDVLLYQSYWIYIKTLIKEHDLQSHVTFLGVLDEKEMCQAFLSTHVFILPSIIENSPNTLSEAAILGVPCVASYIAGVPDVIEDNENGFLYSYDEYYIMADRVIKIFQDDCLAVKFSENIHTKAREMFDSESNTDLVYNAYIDIHKRGSIENG